MRRGLPVAIRSCVAISSVFAAATSAQARAQEPDPTLATFAAEDLDALTTLYQDLHRQPELSLRERKTSARMASELRALGAEVTERVGGFGVVGVLRNGEGKTLLLRADMDALPIAEETGLPYASEVRGEAEDGRPVGFMHACGHDLHMTNLIGTGRWLAAHRELWHGTVLLLFQPAEERGLGAKAVLDDRLFERFGKPDFAVALHVTHNLAADRVGVRAGWLMANVDSVDITVFGRGGHGSLPHLTIDPIVAAAQLVLDLQTIVSREVAATEPAVVTVGAIHAGSKHNIIPDRCELQLTVRSYTDEVRQQIHAAIVRKAKAVAASSRAPEPEVTFSEGTPALHNDLALSARLIPALRRACGEAQVVDVPPAMTGEDFARYGLAGVPIFMFRLGTIAPERLARHEASGVPLPLLHSSRYYPDVRPSLVTGLRATTGCVRELLGGG